MLLDQLLDPSAPWADVLRHNFQMHKARGDLDSYVPRFLLWLAFGRPDLHVLWIPQMWREYHTAQKHEGNPRDCMLCCTERTQAPFDEWLFERLKAGYR